ncbi:MAG: DMT family transporter, partial [Acidimicrobiales bacterium]
MSRRGRVLFALMSVIWGIPYLLIKVAVEDLHPSVIVFGRTAIGALLLLPVAAARGQLRPLLRSWKPIVVYTVIEVAVPWFLLSTAEKRLPSSLTGLLVAAVPLVGAVMAVGLRARDRIRGWQFAGLFLGLVGVAVLLGLD